jgi:hypothetical protein
MAPIRITVEGVGGVKLSSNDELGRFLENKKVQCLIDSDGDQVYGFDSLVDGGTYTLGPPQQQQQQQNGKLLCCSRIFVFNLLFEYGNGSISSYYCLRQNLMSIALSLPMNSTYLQVPRMRERGPLMLAANHR